jgi:hypothetical protein
MSKNLLLTLGFVCVALLMLTTPARAQYGSLPIGTLNNGSAASCQTGGWYYYTDGQGNHYMNCYDAHSHQLPK